MPLPQRSSTARALKGARSRAASGSRTGKEGGRPRTGTRSQITGGVIQGVGQALYEYRWMDDQTGRMLNPNLEEYKLPYSREIPEIDVVLYDNPIGKVSGIGEPPVIPTSAAIANAVYNAIGVRVTSLPMTPDKVLAALARKSA